MKIWVIGQLNDLFNLKESNYIVTLIVSITKFSSVIGSPCAYLWHNQHANM